MISVTRTRMRLVSSSSSGNEIFILEIACTDYHYVLREVYLRSGFLCKDGAATQKLHYLLRILIFNFEYNFYRIFQI